MVKITKEVRGISEIVRVGQDYGKIAVLGVPVAYATLVSGRWRVHRATSPSIEGAIFDTLGDVADRAVEVCHV